MEQQQFKNLLDNVVNEVSEWDGKHQVEFMTLLKEKLKAKQEKKVQELKLKFQKEADELVNFE